MKKIIILTSTVILAFSAASCTKMLENPQKGVISMGEYYAKASVSDAEKLIANTYNSYFNNVEGNGTLNFLDIISDDNLCGGGTWADNANRYRDAQEFILNSASWPFNGSKEYQNLFSVIYKCNLIIEKIPESNDAEMNRIKAEARFLRAGAMFEALRWYGNPPLADHIYSQEDMLAPNGDPAQIIEWILQNYEEAAAILPAVPGKGRQIEIGGRATSGAAWAYAGKAALFYATMFKDNSYATKAVTYFKKVMDSGLYELIPNIGDVHRLAADFCSEYLFERNCAETSSNKSYQNDNRQTWRSIRNDNINIPKAINDYGWGFCNPSKEFVEFMKKHDGVDNVRFKAKLLSYDDIIAMGSTGIIRMNPDCVGYYNGTCLMWADELYTDTGNSFWSKANVPFMRYAEVLLMYAEAQFIANGDSDGSGLAALNKVRVRSQLAPLNAMTYQDIKDERRAELFCEEERFFDLRRWGDAATALKDRGKVRYEFYGYKEGTKEYDVREVPGEGKGWEDRYMWFPYAPDQLLANPNLKQNTGW